MKLNDMLVVGPSSHDRTDCETYVEHAISKNVTLVAQAFFSPLLESWDSIAQKHYHDFPKESIRN